jgi:hypothetical protein
MKTDIVDRLMSYEQGDMNQKETVEFFQQLIDDGLAFRLQGHYGRTAVRLFEARLVQPRKETR